MGFAEKRKDVNVFVTQIASWMELDNVRESRDVYLVSRSVR